MSKHYFIYTVTGGHEVFYAAVDRETDRVWTAPTKEVAQRMAQEAGLETFTERVISKDALLGSLGIESEHRLQIKPEQTQARNPDRPAPSKTPWFIAGGSVDGGSSVPPRLPRLQMRGRKKSGRPKRGGSPFAANQPIAPGSRGDDDVLIVPTQEKPASGPTPFSDKAADATDD